MNQLLLYLGLCALTSAFLITLGTTLLLDKRQEKKQQDAQRFKNIV